MDLFKDTTSPPRIKWVLRVQFCCLFILYNAERTGSQPAKTFKIVAEPDNIFLVSAICRDSRARLSIAGPSAITPPLAARLIRAAVAAIQAQSRAIFPAARALQACHPCR
jgi:hypothetical protein